MNCMKRLSSSPTEAGCSLTGHCSSAGLRCLHQCSCADQLCSMHAALGLQADGAGVVAEGLCCL